MESKSFAEILPNLFYLLGAIGIFGLVYFGAWLIKGQKPDLQVSPIARYGLVFCGLNFVLWMLVYWFYDIEPNGKQTLNTVFISILVTGVYVVVDVLKNLKDGSPRA